MNSFNVSLDAVAELMLHCLEYLQLSETVTNTSVRVAVILRSSVSEADSLRSSSTDILVILAGEWHFLLKEKIYNLLICKFFCKASQTMHLLYWQFISAFLQVIFISLKLFLLRSRFPVQPAQFSASAAGCQCDLNNYSLISQCCSVFKRHWLVPTKSRSLFKPLRFDSNQHPHLNITDLCIIDCLLSPAAGVM